MNFSRFQAESNSFRQLVKTKLFSKFLIFNEVLQFEIDSSEEIFSFFALCGVLGKTMISF